MVLGTRERSPLIIAVPSPSYAWRMGSAGGKPVAQVGPTFDVTNMASTSRVVVRAELVVRRWRGILPWPERVPGFVQEDPGQLKAGETSPALVWWTVDPPPRDGAPRESGTDGQPQPRTSTPWLSWFYDRAGSSPTTS